jgi:hypothetical protein
MVEDQAAKSSQLRDPLSFHRRHLLEKRRKEPGDDDQPYENGEQESSSPESISHGFGERGNQ